MREGSGSSPDVSIPFRFFFIGSILFVFSLIRGRRSTQNYLLLPYLGARVHLISLTVRSVARRALQDGHGFPEVDPSSVRITAASILTDVFVEGPEVQSRLHHGFLRLGDFGLEDN